MKTSKFKMTEVGTILVNLERAANVRSHNIIVVEC